MKRIIKELFVEIELRGRVESHSVDSFDFVMGRSEAVDMPLMVKEMSRSHLRVVARDGQIYIQDLGSKNGTRLSGDIIPQNEEVLYPIGAPLQFGKSKEVVRIRARVEAVKEPAVEEVQPPVSAAPPSEPPVNPFHNSKEDSLSDASFRFAQNTEDSVSQVAEDELGKTDVSHEVSALEKTQILQEHADDEVGRVQTDVIDATQLDDSLPNLEMPEDLEVGSGNTDHSMVADPESLTRVATSPDSLIDQNEVEDLKRAKAQELRAQMAELKEYDEDDATVQPTKQKPEEDSAEVSTHKLSQADEEPHGDQAEEGIPEPPQFTNHTQTRPMHIPKNTVSQATSSGTKSRKISFSKLENVKELVAEITRDAGKAIDENFFNIPPDKRAARKAEKILSEVRKVAAELQEKAYDKHDRIIKKASEKATNMLTEAEADRNHILTEGREMIQKMRADQERANEEALDKIIDEANEKAKNLLEEAENLADKVDGEARQRLAEAQLNAQRLLEDNGQVAEQIVQKAEAEAENILNSAMLKKEQAEIETSELESRASELETLIDRLKSEIEGWDEKVQTSKEAAEIALEQAQVESGKLEAHKRLIEQQQSQIVADFEEFKKQRTEDKTHFIAQIEDDEKRVSQTLEDHKSRVEAEKALLLKDYESQRQRLNADYVRAQEQHEKKLGDLDVRYKEKDEALNVEYLKRREDIESRTEDYQKEHDEKRAEVDRETKAISDSHDQQRLSIEASTEDFQKEHDEKRMGIEKVTRSFQSEHDEKRDGIKQITDSLQAQHELERQKLADETQRVQSEFDELKSELEGEKQNLASRIESLSQNVRELSRSRDDLQVEMKETEKRIEDNENTWKQASAEYEFALAGKDMASKERAELEKQKEELHQKILQLRQKRQDTEDAIDNLENTKAQELKNISIMKEEALKQIGLERERVTDEIASQRQDWEKQREQMEQDAKNQSDQLVTSASRVKAEAEQEAESIVKKARLESQTLAEQVESWKKEQEISMKQTADSWGQEFESGKAKLEAEQAAQAAAFEEELSSKRESLDSEIASQRAEGQKRIKLELADMRVKRTSEIELELDQLKAQYESQKEERATVLAKSLDAKLITHLKPLLGDKAAGEIDNVSSELQKVVMNVMLPDGDFKDEDFRELIGAQASELVSSRSFWKKSPIIAASLFLIVGLPSAYRAFKVQTKEMASIQQETANEIYRQKMEEKARNKPKFEPEMKQLYYGSYTDRVLYTQKYIDNELDPKYREQWILDLDQFFVSELGLSENVIITFIAKESSLIKELRDSRKAINPQFVKESRDDMLKIEQVFLQEIQGTLGSKSNYDQFLSFKQKYYSKKYLAEASGE